MPIHHLNFKEDPDALNPKSVNSDVPRISNKRGTASVCSVLRSQSDEIFWLSETKQQIK